MAISAADIATLSRLLDEAMALDEAQQAAWLAALPAEHRHHAGPLREMLAARASATGGGQLSTLPRLGSDGPAASAGQRIGPYRLIREIGQGGMGSVWLAERADGSFERQVALKLPRLAWGSGLAERMARERQIGALLEHPHIARLYDAGLDELGRPYLAHEYIAGQAIDAWCQAQALDIPQRLQLFLQVARAVAYAHGRLVIHRDIKPSNVLVTSDNQAHLLDFGIAKLLSGDGAGADEGAGSQLTQEQGRMLTPHYASPEQWQDGVVTVASDVYSLGVLLYELLTQRLPYGTAGSRTAALKAALLAGEPPLASSQAADAVAARQLRGDLDAILAKALRHDPLRRYATADAMAADIERYLSGDTVLAQPDSIGYRLAKAMRRHRVGFTAGGAVLLAILTGATASLLQAHRANDAAERARVVKEFVVDVFKVNGRGNSANTELRQLPAEVLLERGAQLIEPKFAGRPQLQAELYGVVGSIFADIGAAQLSADYAGRQLAALEGSGAPRSERAQATLLLARALGLLDRPADAIARTRTAVELADGAPALQTRARLALAKTLLSTAAYDETQKQLGLVDQALAAGNDGDGGNRGSASAVADRVEASNLRAVLLSRQNHFDQARPHFERAIAIAVQSGMPELAAETREMFARYLSAANFRKEARLQLQQALSSLRAAGGPDDVQAALMEATSARALQRPGGLSFEEAREMIAHARTVLAGRPNLPRSFLVQADLSMGLILAFNGRIEEADQALSRITEEDRRKAREQPRLWRELSARLGLIARYLGRHEEADGYLREAIVVSEKLNGVRSTRVVNDYEQYAVNLWMQHRFDEADALLTAQAQIQPLVGSTGDKRRDWGANSLRITHARLKLESGDPAGALRMLPAEDKFGANSGEEYSLVRGSALCLLGQPAEGLRALDEYLRGIEAMWWQFDPDLARARAVAGLCALAAGDRARATGLAKLAREALDKQPRLSAYFRAPCERLERQLAAQRKSHVQTAGSHGRFS